MKKHLLILATFLSILMMNPIYLIAEESANGPSQTAASDDLSKFGCNPPATELLQKGKNYLAKGLYKQAVMEYSNAVQADPKCAIAYYSTATTSQGMLLQMDPNNSAAIDEILANLDKSIEIEPKFALAYMGRGYTYLISGNVDKAISEFSQALELGEKNDTGNVYQVIDAGEVYYQRGYAYTLKNDQDKAINDLTKAIEKDPNSGKAYMMRSNAYYYTKANQDKAWEDLQKAESLGEKTDALWAQDLTQQFKKQ